MIENSISKEELSTEEKFIKKENKLSDVIFHEEHEKEIKAFHKFISNGLNNTLYEDGSPNRGADRAKSYNPMMDAYEKKHVEELPVNKIFKLEEFDESQVHGMKSMGVQVQRPNNSWTSSYALTASEVGKGLDQQVNDVKHTPYENTNTTKEEDKEIHKYLKEVTKKESGFMKWWKAWMKQLSGK